MEVRRRSLCETVRTRSPRLLAVIAPAGFGKSTFVRQLLSEADDSAICDCLAVRADVDLARAVLATLAVARPILADAIAQAHLEVSTDARDWQAVVLQFWSGDVPNIFVFENAEALTRSPSACALFEQLLRSRDRSTIVCSREIVPMPYGHGVDPCNVLTFGSDELRFTAQEIRELLPDLRGTEQSELERISRGWPIIVALLGRAARERPFGEVMAGLSRVVHSELLGYLASEFVGQLSDRDRMLAVIFSALPEVCYVDIRRAWPSVTPADIDRFAARMPLSRSTDGVLHLHPLMIELLREHAVTEIPPLVKQAAEAAQAHGDEIRAAEFYLSIGDQHAAASVLRNVGGFLMATPTPRLAAVISRFGEETLFKFPALWCIALDHRGYSIPPYEWLRSAQAIWNGLTPDVEPTIRTSVFSSLMVALTNIGSCSNAAKLLDEYARSALDPGGVAMVNLWSAALDSYDGRYDRISTFTARATPLLDASSLTHALYLSEVVCTVSRTRGEWERDDEILRRARELFDRVPLSVSLFGLVESAFAHWFAGKDTTCDRFVDDLEQRLTTANERGHRFFIACVRDAAKDARYGYERTKERVQGLLIASARSQTRQAAWRLACDAVSEADKSERRYLRVIARCALALLDDAGREGLLSAALSIASKIDSVPMQGAVAALLACRDDVGMLAPFVARYEAFRVRKTTTIDVHVLRAEVFVEGTFVRLSRSELVVLMALSQAPRPFSIVELGDLLFPDLDADSAGNRLYVYIHRLRRRLGHDTVVGDERGYRLGTAVDVDLWRVRPIVAKTRGDAPLSAAEHVYLVSYETPSPTELDAVVVRLRLPESIANDLRANLEQLLMFKKERADCDSRRMHEELSARA